MDPRADFIFQKTYLFTCMLFSAFDKSNEEMNFPFPSFHKKKIEDDRNVSHTQRLPLGKSEGQVLKHFIVTSFGAHFPKWAQADAHKVELLSHCSSKCDSQSSASTPGSVSVLFSVPHTPYLSLKSSGYHGEWDFKAEPKSLHSCSVFLADYRTSWDHNQRQTVIAVMSRSLLSGKATWFHG